MTPRAPTMDRFNDRRSPRSPNCRPHVGIIAAHSFGSPEVGQTASEFAEVSVRTNFNGRQCQFTSRASYANGFGRTDSAVH